MPGNAVRPRYPHLVLGPLVVGLELGEPERPVGDLGPGNRAVKGRGAELVLQQPHARAAPVVGRAAHRLAHRRGLAWEGAGDDRGAGANPRVVPAEFGIHRGFIVLDLVRIDVPPGFEDHDVDAHARKLVGERAAARARTNDDDHGVVVVIVGDRGQRVGGPRVVSRH